MGLAPRDRLGSYEIIDRLGAGGMGEVYRARDTKLGRDVAIKTLPPGVAQDAERLQRFKREAQVLASLNHPNIAAIYGLEEERGTPFLVLELVEGDDLAERLKRGAIPVAAALEIARQIAAALEEAHEKGIVHRDLKPANVKLGRGGRVKVLDFGLAKAYAGEPAGPADAANSPTMTQAATTAGMIIGTAGYMSPEQARGKRVDRRADIWAFGVVVYEMLTGRRLFDGESVTDVLAAVMRDDVDWSALPGNAPPAVKRLIARCLERDPMARLQTIGEARSALDEPVAPARSGVARWAAVAIAAVALVVAVGLEMRGRTPPKPDAEPGATARSIAVLPFVNSSGTADDEYLADGMTDELIAGLGKVPGLRVAARSSAFSLKGQNVEAREAARRLGVDSILEGTVRRSGKRLRVTASLVNASDGLQLWSSSFENEGGDAFAVQDEVTRGVVSGLSLTLGDKALAASQAGRTSDHEAHDLYLRGLASANAGSEADLLRALDFYQQALVRDPGFAQAYVGIGWVHVFLADAYVAPVEAYPKARAAARAALERDDRIAEAHAVLAYATWSLDWGHGPEVPREFDRAVELDPNSVNSLFLRAAYKCMEHDIDASLPDMNRAERLDPLSPMIPVFRELCNYVAGRYPAVIEAHKRTAALDPTFIYIESWTAAAYREMGDVDAALREYALIDKATGGAPQYGLALTYARTGRMDDARAIMRTMDQLASSRYVPYFMRAVVHAAVGDLDGGIALLQSAADSKETFLRAYSVPPMAPLAGDPRGRKILEQLRAIRSGG